MHSKTEDSFCYNIFELLVTQKDCLFAWKELINVVDAQLESSFAMIGVINKKKNFDIVAMTDKSYNFLDINKIIAWSLFTDLKLKKEWKACIEKYKPSIYNKKMSQKIESLNNGFSLKSFCLNNSLIMPFKTPQDDKGVIILGNKKNGFFEKDLKLLNKASNALEVLLVRRQMESELRKCSKKKNQLQYNLQGVIKYAHEETKIIQTDLNTLFKKIDNIKIAKNNSQIELSKKELNEKLRNSNYLLLSLINFMNITQEKVENTAYIVPKTIIENKKTLKKDFKISYKNTSKKYKLTLSEKTFEYIIDIIITFIKKVRSNNNSSILCDFSDENLSMTFKFYSCQNFLTTISDMYTIISNINLLTKE